MGVKFPKSVQEVGGGGGERVELQTAPLGVSSFAQNLYTQKFVVECKLWQCSP